MQKIGIDPANLCPTFEDGYDAPDEDDLSASVDDDDWPNIECKQQLSTVNSMSFYSSIVLFHPGGSRQIRSSELRKICDTLRTTFSLEDDFFSANVCYENAHKPPPEILWDETYTIGTIDQDLEDRTKWDHEGQSWAWLEIWPDRSMDDKVVSRANVNLGSLPDLAIAELSRSDDGRTSPCDISITEVSVSIGPVQVGELTGELPEDECYGCMEVSLSGYGYFTWQPLSAYWKSVNQSATLQKMLEVCKNIQAASSRTNISLLKEHLGEVFLNREEYQTGDWIVSVSESG